MNFSIIIQAGGESSRMGVDKGLILFLGQPMVARIASRLLPIAGEVLITANNPQEYERLGLPVFSDLIPNRGALGGLYTALSVSGNSLVGVVACDMPFINANLLNAQRERMVASGADIVIPHTGEGLEPFHAVYRKETCLPHVQGAIEANKWRVDAWFSKVNVEMFPKNEIKRFDPQMLSFRNVNTPDELQSAVDLASCLEGRGTSF